MVVTESEEYDDQIMVLKRLRTILDLWEAVADHSPQKRKLGKQLYQEIKKYKGFLLYDIFANHGDGEDCFPRTMYFEAACVLMTMAEPRAVSGWDEPEEDKMRLKLLTLAKKLLGVVYKDTEVRKEDAVLGNVCMEPSADYLGCVVNRELVVLNLQLRKRDHQVLSLVEELMKFDKVHGHVDNYPSHLLEIGSCIHDLQEGGSSDDDVIWQALCSVVPSLVPLGKCDECDIEETSFRAFSVCAQCKTAAYCSYECQRAHWKGDHKATCHPKTPTFSSK